MARIRLYDWAPSPFCMKVRAVLAYKGVDYDRVNVLGAYLDFRRRSPTGKVPAIDLDGTILADSTDIVLTLEERFPDPPVIPSDPRERALCHVVEDWCDEALYFIGLYYQWAEPEGRKLVAKAFPGPAGRVARIFYQRRILGQLRGQGTLLKPAEHLRRDLDRELDAVAHLLANGNFVLGERPYACDFALVSQLVYLSRTPVGGAALKGRTRIANYMERMKQLR